MALTFTPDNRAQPGMYGCPWCGIYTQILSPALDPDTGQEIVLEIDPGVFYTQMQNDMEATIPEIEEHMAGCALNPDAPQKKIP